MMKNIIFSLVFSCGIFLYGCSGDDSATGGQGTQTATAPKVSQAETMEQIWASDLDTAEKARRVRELLQASN